MVILRSIAITLCVSGTCGLLFWSLDYSFIKAFTLSTIIQFIGFWMFNSIMQHVRQVKMTELENQRIAEYTKQSINVECSYCKSNNLIPLHVNGDNDFKCVNCGKENAVYVGITVTQKTNPMNVDSLAVNTLNPDEQAAIDSISTNGI